MKKNVLFLLVMGFVLVLGAHDLIAQPPPALPSGPSQAPIDGGLSILALGGGAYALKKLRDRRSK